MQLCQDLLRHRPKFCLTAKTATWPPNSTGTYTGNLYKTFDEVKLHIAIFGQHGDPRGHATQPWCKYSSFTHKMRSFKGFGGEARKHQSKRRNLSLSPKWAQSRVLHFNHHSFGTQFLHGGCGGFLQPRIVCWKLWL